MRRTKILATLGPASESASTVRKLIQAGANGFRVNFSHGDEPDHRRAIATARSEADRLGRTIFLVADLQGPKMRLGAITGSPIRLDRGATWVLDDDPAPGGSSRVQADVPDLRRVAAPGDPVLLGDGDVELRVLSIGPAGVRTRVVSGGSVSAHAGVYLPRARLRRSILGEKDRRDLAVAFQEGVDYVAISFVRAAEDVVAVKRFARTLRPRNPPGWIAKIERAEALRSIDGILREVDAIMVARGDLGIEVPLARLALEQKRLVARGRAAAVPTIVATQMLLSMVHSARPTRAEATDVANAVLDGADCVMLSEESAVGEHPVEAVKWLDRIAVATEPAASFGPPPLPSPSDEAEPGERAVARAALALAHDLRAGMIVTPTHSGRTARWVASGRPHTPVIALSSRPDVRRRLGLVWGVVPHDVPASLDLLGVRDFVQRQLRNEVRGGGGPVVVTAGYPVEGRPTNLLTVVESGARRSASRGKGR